MVLLAAIAVGGVTPALAQEKLIMVLDSSGSMAGQIESRAKLDVARSTIRDLLGKVKPTTQLGLIAYGHRRKGDCADIETIYEVGKPDGAAIMAAVNRLNAVGKTPLSTAVRKAAEQLNFTEDKATVILISDGKETCGADPCALGRELKSKGLDFKVHVVGFDIKSDERAGLQCLADETGGQYVPANSAADLGAAIYKTIEVAQAPAAAPEPEPDPVVEPGLRVDVVVSEGGETWKGDIGLKLFGEKQGLDGKREKVADAWRVKSGHIFKNMKDGAFVMEVLLADHRHIKRTVQVDVRGNEAQIVTVNLNIGQVRFDASLAEEGEALKHDLGWWVYGPKEGLAGKRKKIAEFWRVKSGRVFWLPAGTWRVEGAIADAKYLRVVRNELTVQAGGGDAHAFSFNAGTVRFDASLSAEGAAFKGDLGWTILSQQKDLSGNRKKITNFWRAKSGGIFLLPAGEWLIEGVLADHKYVSLSQTISVSPASEAAHSFNFNAATVRFDVTVNGQPTGADLGLTVLGLEKDLAGKQKKITDFWRTRSGAVTVLPAGKFLLKGLLADQKEVKGETTLELNPGDEKPVALDLKNP
ncbi:MAG: VWA domain-containing protein [Rhizobiales bacterium]|nr:VWA domain-containing protein [Hyphomicrobiales bacterium]